MRRWGYLLRHIAVWLWPWLAFLFNRRATSLSFDVLGIIQAFLFLFASAFMAASMADGEPMLPSIYGQAVDYPAEWWAAWFMIGHGMGAFGMWNGLYRISIIGITLVTPAYLLLAVFALPAAYGSVITLHSVLVGAPIQMLTVVVVLVYGDREADDR